MDRLRRWHKSRAKSMTLSALVLLHAGMLGLPFATAQSVTTPTALPAFEQQALLAFNPSGKPLSSITLNGSAVWTAGSLQETGNVVLKASADGSTSETWTLPSQHHGHTQSAWSAGRTCNFTDNKGAAHAQNDPNCMRSVTWFAPWSGFMSVGSFLSSDSTRPIDRTNGMDRLSFQTNFSSNGVPNSSSTTDLALLESRAAVTVTFDQRSALPMSLDFEQILDSDPAHTIQYQIVFSDYRPESGFVVPHRIQRYIQRTLQADITITRVNVE